MNLPNKITLCRFLIIPFLIILIVYYKPGLTHIKWWAFVLFCIASLTDAIDGYLARTQNLKSRFGTFLDPLADKALLLSTFISLYFSQYAYKIPGWALIIIVSRDIIMMSVLFLYLTSSSTIIFYPNFLGKMTTAVQMTTIATLLLELKMSALLWPLAVLLTLASGGTYLVREWKRLNEG